MAPLKSGTRSKLEADAKSELAEAALVAVAADRVDSQPTLQRFDQHRTRAKIGNVKVAGIHVQVVVVEHIEQLSADSGGNKVAPHRVLHQIRVRFQLK